MGYGETTIVSFFRKTRSRDDDDGESASCGFLRGGDVVDETNTTDSFALANSTASTINFKDDDLGSKEKFTHIHTHKHTHTHTFDQGDLRAPPTREPKG